MRFFIALFGLCASAAGVAQVSDSFDPDAYVQVEVILFTTEATAGATNRTGVRAELLEIDQPRAFPSNILSIENSRLTKAWDASWFEGEWSGIAPHLLDAFPEPEVPEEAEEAEGPLEPVERVEPVEPVELDLPIVQTASDFVPEIPQEPTLWERYQAWYTDLIANCFAQRDREDYRLGRALAGLERSSSHRVLMHGAWVQPVSARARPILLTGGDALEVGFLSVTREGFFAAEVRFWRPLGTGYAELHEVRPMRSRRAYYFDHPLMGVVLRIDPIRVPSEFR